VCYFASFCEFITRVALIASRSAYGMPINEVDALLTGLMSLVVDFVVHELVPVVAESRRLLHRWSRCLRSAELGQCGQPIADRTNASTERFQLKIMQNNWFHRASIIEFPGVVVWEVCGGILTPTASHPRGADECSRTSRLSASALRKWHRRRATRNIVSVRTSYGRRFRLYSPVVISE